VRRRDDAETRGDGLVVAAPAARPSRSGRRTPSGGRRGDREDVGDRAGPPGGADVLLGGGCSRAVREDRTGPPGGHSGGRQDHVPAAAPAEQSEGPLGGGAPVRRPLRRILRYSTGLERRGGLRTRPD